MNAAARALRRLEGQSKGAAFAYEMTLDTHRYGALIVLDRWSTLVRAFGPHLRLSRRPTIVESGARAHSGRGGHSGRCQPLAGRLRALLSRGGRSLPAGVSIPATTFAEERNEAGQSAKLGPMLPEDYTSARRIFLEDLAAR